MCSVCCVVKLKYSFVYVSFVQGHFVHRQVHLYSSCIVVKMKAILSLQLLCYINFALACHRTIEKENYHQQDITLLKESNCMGIDIKMPLIWYFLYRVTVCFIFILRKHLAKQLMVPMYFGSLAACLLWS